MEEYQGRKSGIEKETHTNGRSHEKWKIGWVKKNITKSLVIFCF